MIGMDVQSAGRLPIRQKTFKKDMMPYLFSIFSAIVAVFMEYKYSHGYSIFDDTIWMIAGLLIQIGIWGTYSSSPTFLSGLVVFSSATLILRVCVSQFVLHQPLTIWTMAAVLLVFIANLILKVTR
jgi:hypothetical protein